MSIKASASKSSLRDGTGSSPFSTRLAQAVYDLTSPATVHTDRTKPVVPNKVSLQFAVRYVPIRFRIDVLLREPEIDHVDSLFVWRQSDGTVPQLDVAMENPTPVHVLQSL